MIDFSSGFLIRPQWAAEFYVVMYSLAAVVDTNLTHQQQVTWLAEQARRRVPDWSYIADMYGFVKRAYENDPQNWEQARDKVYERYQLHSSAGYTYKYPWDSGINFAASIVSLLYGQGDYKKTIRIATLSGWDADNPTATWGGLLGLLYGHQGLQAYFDKSDFSDIYWIERTRFNLPVSHDNFTDMAQRGLGVIDKVVTNSMGGKVSEDQWLVPLHQPAVEPVDMEPLVSPWHTIEDSDPRWKYDGFVTEGEQWNASGATLTKGNAGCSAEIEFEGSAVHYYAFRNSLSGSVRIYLDDQEQGVFSLSSQVGAHGQYYIKVFESQQLPVSKHRLRIECDAGDTLKTIDMISVSDSTAKELSISQLGLNLFPEQKDIGLGVCCTAE